MLFELDLGGGEWFWQRMRKGITLSEACVPGQVLQRLRWSLGCTLFMRNQHLWEGEGSGIPQREMSVCHLSPCCRQPWGAYCLAQGSGVAAGATPLGTPAQSIHPWGPEVKSLRWEAVCGHTPQLAEGLPQRGTWCASVCESQHVSAWRAFLPRKGWSRDLWEWSWADHLRFWFDRHDKHVGLIFPPVVIC